MPARSNDTLVSSTCPRCGQADQVQPVPSLTGTARLAPPTPPRADPWGCGLVLGWGLLATLLGYVTTIRTGANATAADWLTWVLVGLLPLGGGAVGLAWTWRQARRRRPRWERARARWERLRYCQRCAGVFLLDGSTVVPVSQMATLLAGGPPPAG
jgi:hypothetical protein